MDIVKVAQAVCTDYKISIKPVDEKTALLVSNPPAIEKVGVDDWMKLEGRAEDNIKKFNDSAYTAKNAIISATDYNGITLFKPSELAMPTGGKDPACNVEIIKDAKV